MAGSKGFAGAFSRHYEKLIAILVLIGLLISLVYLSLTAGTRQAQEKAFEREMKNLPVEHPSQAPIDPAPYEVALATIRTPFLFPVPTNKVINLLEPEPRAWCPTCQGPVLLTATNCPFCLEAIVGGSDFLDSDGGGISDKRERALGLNPYDRLDDSGDLDGDGFTNLEEVEAKTDPADPKSHPPIEDRLRVKQISFKPVTLLFTARSKMPDGSVKCQINDVTRRRTFYAQESERVGDTEYTLEKFTERYETKIVPGIGTPQKVETSTVLLKGRGETITLVLNQETLYKDFTVVLVNPLDNTEVTLGQGAETVIRGQNFKVTIDGNTETVEIRNLSNDRKITVPPLP